MTPVVCTQNIKAQNFSDSENVLALLLMLKVARWHIIQNGDIQASCKAKHQMRRKMKKMVKTK